jgi:hypothetical protein
MFAVKVGDEVGFGRYGRYTYHSTGFARVAKVNGFGHITLETGKVFDKHGRERSTNSGLELIEAGVLRQRIARETAEREQRARFNALEQKIQSMHTYSGTDHITPEAKAELLALVEAL